MAFSLLCCLVLLATSLVVQSIDPCQDYIRLDQPDRSTAAQIGKGQKPRSDAALSPGWYRFVSGAGGTIPDYPPGVGACSSVIPIWHNGTQIPNDGLEHDIDLCYQFNALTDCGAQSVIKAKRCNNYIVYELLPTAANSTTKINDAAYCAGTEKACPAGQSSKTGFTPNCYKAPTITDEPVMRFHEYDDRFEFSCGPRNFDINTGYEVMFYLKDTELKNLELKSPYDKLIITEQELAGENALGNELTCKVRGRYLDQPTGRWGAMKSSRPYFLGVQIVNSKGEILSLKTFKMNLKELDETYLNVSLTVPFRCDGMEKRRCHIDLSFLNDDLNDRRPIKCKQQRIEQLKLSQCGVSFWADEWAKPHTIQLRATRDFNRDGNKRRVLKFELKGMNLNGGLWTGYQPRQIEVFTEDFNTGNSYCSSLNDPHMRTFDGHSYNLYFEGEFVLYRHKTLPFELRTFYKKCNRFATCNCGVAARAGDDVIIVDRCNSLGDIKIYGADKKAEFNLLRTRTISTDDIISPNFKIFSLSGGRRFEIYYPHGAKARIDLTTGAYRQFMNVWVYPAPDDVKRVEGLCGNYDGDKTNDLVMRDGSLFTGSGSKRGQQPKTFSLEWRVPSNDSIYNGNTPDKAITYDNIYCSCKRESGQTVLECRSNSDVARCDQRGDDITGKNFEFAEKKRKTPPGQKKKQDKWTGDWKPPGQQKKKDKWGGSKKWEGWNNKWEFNSDDAFDPPTPTWPTPSGWTEQKARKFCEDQIKKCKMFQSKKCKLNIADDVDLCVQDILLSGTTDWAMTAIASYQDKCLTDLIDRGVTPPDDATCMNECNFQGVCVKGECKCNPGFAGADCSLRDNVIPDVMLAPPCDLAESQCDVAAVFGNDFLNSNELTCQHEAVEVVEGSIEHSGEKDYSKGSFENFAEVTCPLTSRRNKRAAGKAPSPGHSLLAVSNKQNQAFSKPILFTIFNSQCQICNLTCEIKPKTCLIAGVCYSDGDTNPGTDDDAKYLKCKSDITQTSWTRVPNEGIPDWGIVLIAVGAGLAVLVSGIVVYVKCIRKRSKVVS